MKNSAKLNSFMEELNALLTKYEATISFNYDGDNHGIYDERTDILFLKDGAKSKWDDEVVAMTHDTYLSANNTSKKIFNQDWE